MIYILEREGLDDHHIIAKWDEDVGWVEVREDYRLFEDPTFEKYTEELMLDHFDGPDLFATTADAYEGPESEL